MKPLSWLLGASLAFASTVAMAQQYTRQQQEAACSDDAFRLCGDVIPDEQRVAACMAVKRAALSERCRYVFEASMPADDRKAPRRR